MPEYTPIVDEDACDLCGLCVELCPTGVFYEEEGRLRIRADLCIGCGACVPLCPRSAIGLVVDP